VVIIKIKNMPFKNIYIKFRSISNLIYGALGFFLGTALLLIKDYLWGIICISIGGFLVFRNYKKLKKNKGEVLSGQKIIKETFLKTITSVKKFNRKKILIIGALIVIVALSATFFYLKPFFLSKAPAATFDDFPIWLMRDGKVAVYRELDFYKDSVEKQIVVVNLGDESQSNLRVYESVSKNIAQHAADLKFNIQPDEIIDDDPAFYWNISINRAGEKILLTMETKVNLSKVSDACNNEQTIQEILNLNLKPESFDDCMKYWKIKEEQTQEKIEKELAEARTKEAIAKSEPVKIIKPDAPEYADIQKKAKETLRKLQVDKAIKELYARRQASQESMQEEKTSQWTVYFSKDMFPSNLLGLPLAKIQSEPATKTCYDTLNPGKFASALYQDGDRIISVAATQYINADIAKTVPKICSDFSETNYTKPQLNSSIGLQKKPDVLDYPFWVALASYQGSPFVAMSFSVIEDTVVAIVMAKGPSGIDGGTETEHQNAMTIVLTYLKQKVGCGGDSDCYSYSCSACQLGQRVCSKGDCVECTYDGHCKDGYECKDNACKAKKAVLPPSQPETSCQTINLSEGEAFYNFSKESAPCSEYQNSFSASKISLRCKYSAGQWRNYWVEKVNTAGFQKLKIKADLGILDHTGFFDECSRNGGVKSDDYVDLIVLSQDPMPTLDIECDRIAPDSEWSQCGVANSGTGVLAHCGVSKCATSKKCDFEVDVSGLNAAYLVFRTGDAWMADIEGTLSNLQVCQIE